MSQSITKANLLLWQNTFHLRQAQAAHQYFLSSRSASIYAPVHEINDKIIEKPNMDHKGYVLKNTSDTAIYQIDSHFSFINRIV